MEQTQRQVAIIRAIHNPVIATIHGHCLAGGTDLAFSCDIILGRDAARIGLVMDCAPAPSLDEEALRLVDRIGLIDRELLGRRSGSSIRRWSSPAHTYRSALRWKWAPGRICHGAQDAGSSRRTWPTKASRLLSKTALVISEIAWFGSDGPLTRSIAYAMKRSYMRWRFIDPAVTSLNAFKEASSLKESHQGVVILRATESKPVKSAQRVLELLEYFSANRKQTSVMEVCRVLGYPQSSTSELVHCLVSLGYLSHDPKRRTFRPTPRVAILGAWVLPELFRQGHLLPMMDELNQKTTELIALATTVELTVRYIHVVEAINPIRMHVPQGSTRPLLMSATGKLFLTTYDERKVKALVHRLNASEENPEKRVRYEELAPELDQIRKQGYAVSYNKVNPGGGMLAMLLPTADESQPLAIGIGGVSTIIESNLDRYLDALRGAIEIHCPSAAAKQKNDDEWTPPPSRFPPQDPFYTRGFRA